MMSMPSRLLAAIVLGALALTPACTTSSHGLSIAPPSVSPSAVASVPVATASTAVSGAPRLLTGRIVFSAGARHGEDVFEIRIDGTGLRRLTSDPGADFDPAVSP